MSKELLVSEQFYSIQGEGMTTGRPANFLRLAKCNLMCGGAGTEQDGKLHNGATWRCDTIEVWSVGLARSFDSIISFMEPCNRLIITGGEPLMHDAKICEFLEYLYHESYKNFPKFIEVETNGTIKPSPKLIDYVQQWNVSPKLANSGVKDRIRFKPDVINFFANEDNPGERQFKFVVTTEADLVEVDDFALPPYMVWLMPGADNQDDLNRLHTQVAEWAKARRYNFSNRLHIALWNKKTGV